ncbi:hypothetical protein [Methanobacterium ferruginis]|uniref:hypothetical protein n=1 Tax=Methanobacterium ferruginis TaxID=710191 RepID=UPI002573BAE0|nr:hypothetical protein [Methanobacterium ferruginis]BDZ68254.1 hypothetical protein GCM10025860_17020 [Methanobacterium ferruginis]
MITKVKVETSEENDIKTDIPSIVGNELKLCPGDSLEWELQKKEGVWVAVIRKVE